jgi:hypothetical protein
MSKQVVIVGGGVIGLLTAFNLAAEVDRVVLCDQGEVGRESSWAGGGIVSPLYPWRYSTAVTALAHWSQDFYPQLGERLFNSTGVDPEVHTTGLYWLDLDDEAEALAWAAREQRPLSAVDISAAYDAVPVLGPGYRHASTWPAWPTCATRAWSSRSRPRCWRCPTSPCASTARSPASPGKAGASSVCRPTTACWPPMMWCSAPVPGAATCCRPWAWNCRWSRSKAR